MDGPGRKTLRPTVVGSLSSTVEDDFSIGKAVVTPASPKCSSDPVLWLLLVSVRSLASSLLQSEKQREKKGC